MSDDWKTRPTARSLLTSGADEMAQVTDTLRDVLAEALREWAGEGSFRLSNAGEAADAIIAALAARGVVLAREDAEFIVAAQIRLTHKPVTNPMYPKPLCNHDGEEWPCLTELQVTEGLYLARAARGDAHAAAGPVGDGVRTDCPIASVHEHTFRGPHTFDEWYYGRPILAASQPITEEPG